MKFYSQKDPRWKDEKLGTCKDTLGQSSCFITSLCNLALNLNTSDKTPSELNKWLIKNGGYSDGCLLNSAKGAEGVGLVSKGRTGINPEHICICETDHWKSKGVPQHFFVYSDGQAIDPLDLNPTWKKNPYKIVSYRVFTVKAPKVPKEKEKPVETILDPVKVIPALVEAGEITSNEKPMNLQGYRTIISSVAAFLVSMGMLSQVEANQLIEGVLAIASVATLVSTVYFRLKSKK